MNFSIEYLVTIETKGGFCDSVETFNNLLKAYSEIKLREGRILFKEIEIIYVVKTDEVKNQNQRYFHTSFTLTDIKKEDAFLELLKMFRDIVYKANGKINVLWDDLSVYYSQKSYPLIHKTENLLRKLISKFMLSNLGMEWSAQTLPAEVVKSIKNKRSQLGVTDILHDVDFIQLADFLFKPYQTKGLSSLYSSIAKIESDSKFDPKSLLEYIPKSNWQRYFSSIVNCDDGYLAKRWEKLYELRCLIAHNTVIAKKEFLEVQTLCKEIDEKLIEAINDIDKVIIPEGDIEVLHENVASNLNKLSGEFLEAWKSLNTELINKFISNQKFTEEELKMKATISSIMKLVDKYKFLDTKIVHQINELRHIRHQVVHETNQKLSDQELENKTKEVKQIIDVIKTITPPTHNIVLPKTRLDNSNEAEVTN